MLSKKRILWLDMARCFAIFSIILNHSIDRTLHISNSIISFLLGNFSLDAIFRVVLYVLSRLGVPIFLMITGALTLSKKFETWEDVLHFYKHNLLKIFITSELWILIMYWIIVLFKVPGYEPISKFSSQLIWMVRTLLFDSTYTYGNIWYIPVILSIYTIIPLVAIFIHKFSVKAMFLPISLLLLYGYLLPNVNHVFLVLGFETGLGIGMDTSNILSIYFPYLVFGYLIYEGFLKRLKRFWLYFLTIFFWIIAIFLTFSYEKVDSHYNFGYYDSDIMLLALFSFEIIRRWGSRLESKHPAQQWEMIAYISKVSFAIYFIHIIVMEAIHFQLGDITPFAYINLLIYHFVPIFVSLVVIRLLSLLAWTKKYLVML
ncbi:acyltransferase [Bulleidia sp. zg-1006]|uniref:acyltransferase n=1 Tax=Bulleidia sp. zg-1006 TaxID=2806552 RepID=UPI00193A1DC2|nr:acyltransferase [Bulleidia sp. zg-1006]QRG87265.1 acyltransferase [Bulleidia sp. zg-1006]